MSQILLTFPRFCCIYPKSFLVPSVDFNISFTPSGLWVAVTSYHVSSIYLPFGPTPSPWKEPLGHRQTQNLSARRTLLLKETQNDNNSLLSLRRSSTHPWVSHHQCTWNLKTPRRISIAQEQRKQWEQNRRRGEGRNLHKPGSPSHTPGALPMSRALWLLAGAHVELPLS